MIPLIRHYLWAFFFDQNAAKRFMVGFGALVGQAIAALAVFGYSTIATWDRKTLVQHVLFAFAGTLATMLPGPALAKPAGSGLVELAPPRGYTNFPFIAAGVLSVVQALILGLAFHAMGLNDHGWMLVVLPISALQGWAVWRALR